MSFCAKSQNPYTIIPPDSPHVILPDSSHVILPDSSHVILPEGQNPEAPQARHNNEQRAERAPNPSHLRRASLSATLAMTRHWFLCCAQDDKEEVTE